MGERQARAASRLRSEAGNSLVLMPVAVLIVLGLGTLAVDTAVLFRAEGELHDLAAGLANDVVAAAVDVDAFYASTSIGEPAVWQLDPDRVDEVIAVALAARVPADGADDGLAPVCTGTPQGADPPRVEVTCRGTARTLLRLARFGDRTVTIEATATATLVTDGLP